MSMIEALTEPTTPEQEILAREKRFDWPLCYEAEDLVLGQLEAFLVRNAFAHHLSERMRLETGTLLLDWVDHVVVGPQNEPQWREVGYTEDSGAETPAGVKALWHPEAMLPRVLLDPSVASLEFPGALALRVESISDFMAAHGVSGEPEGEPLSRWRRV